MTNSTSRLTNENDNSPSFKTELLLQVDMKVPDRYAAARSYVEDTPESRRIMLEGIKDFIGEWIDKHHWFEVLPSDPQRG